MPIPEMIVLLSGAVSSGKTTLGTMLVERFGFRLVKTKEVIRRYFPGVQNERRALQDCGDQLDKRTGGAWVRDEIRRYIEEEKPTRLLVDAVRIEKQVEAIRRAYGPHVFHVHLEAPKA